MRKYINHFFAMYSENESFLSKKRVESGVAFAIAQIGMVVFLVINYDTILITEVLMWATLEFTVSGYMLTQIQKEKSENSNRRDHEREII